LDRELTEEDITYARESLQKVKVPYPVHAIVGGKYFIIEKEDGPAVEHPELLENMS
jgi:hypothetical protein